MPSTKNNRPAITIIFFMLANYHKLAICCEQDFIAPRAQIFSG
jgi:hypothetical protein